jgi:hypothetical protein
MVMNGPMPIYSDTLLLMPDTSCDRDKENIKKEDLTPGPIAPYASRLTFLKGRASK